MSKKRLHSDGIDRLPFVWKARSFEWSFTGDMVATYCYLILNVYSYQSKSSEWRFMWELLLPLNDFNACRSVWRVDRPSMMYFKFRIQHTPPEPHRSPHIPIVNCVICGQTRSLSSNLSLFSEAIYLTTTCSTPLRLSPPWSPAAFLSSPSKFHAVLNT